MVDSSLLDELKKVPHWDDALSFPSQQTKIFNFGDLGDWHYVAEAPSLWKLALPEISDENRQSAAEALGLIGEARRASHREHQLDFDTITITNTMSCNLGCSYCYNYTQLEQNSHPTRSEIPFSQARIAIDLLFKKSRADARLTIQFIGGEPFAKWNSLTQIIDYAIGKAGAESRIVRFGINTNATLLTTDRLAWINKRPIYLFLSYDGPKFLHDRNRPTASGGSSYDAVSKGIDLYLSAYKGPFKSARLTVDLKYGLFSEVMAHAVDWGFDDVSIGFDSKAVANREELIDTLLADLRSVGRFSLVEYRSGRLKRFSWFNEVWSQLVSCAPRYRPCKAGDGYLAVDTKGRVVPCHRYVGGEKRILGELTTEDSSFVKPAFIHENTGNTDCNACWARRICGGECHAVLDDIGPSLITKQSLCVIRRAIYVEALRVFAQLKSETPELLLKLSSLANTHLALE